MNTSHVVLLAECAAAGGFAGAAGATLSFWRKHRAKRAAAKATVTEPAAEPDTGPEPEPEPEPTIDLICPGCNDAIPCHFHLHLTPVGIMAHVDSADMELHEMTCKGADA